MYMRSFTVRIPRLTFMASRSGLDSASLIQRDGSPRRGAIPADPHHHPLLQHRRGASKRRRRPIRRSAPGRPVGRKAQACHDRPLPGTGDEPPPAPVEGMGPVFGKAQDNSLPEPSRVGVVAAAWVPGAYLLRAGSAAGPGRGTPLAGNR